MARVRGIVAGLGVASAVLLGAMSAPAEVQAAGAWSPIDQTSVVAKTITKICGVVADAGPLLALIGTFPQATPAVAIAQAFCAAVPRGGAKRAAQVTVNGRAMVGGVAVVRGVAVPYGYGGG